jgi:hypothetical protein
MIYSKEFPLTTEAPPQKTPIWAIAYDVNNETGNKRLMCKPTLGEIHNSIFYPYKKGTHECKTKGVTTWSRIFTDTENEAIRLYNTLIDMQINILNQRIQDAKNNKIPEPSIDNTINIVSRNIRITNQNDNFVSIDWGEIPVSNPNETTWEYSIDNGKTWITIHDIHGTKCPIQIHDNLWKDTLYRAKATI